MPKSLREEIEEILFRASRIDDIIDVWNIETAVDQIMVEIERYAKQKEIADKAKAEAAGRTRQRDLPL